ncbi:hypothetical protein N7478_011387 [Penicillium angulare]|uniref:uncharacterized protein n=1 Tax=Penicillium angulare TaxID=116970 RepID=UPI0025417B0E|nr:uncharacterized protein N7478_011387 [Penicillium angulare]KAJ5263782.1 hypothetical protein N7478_011387 [Penicillium angulare]
MAQTNMDRALGALDDYVKLNTEDNTAEFLKDFLKVLQPFPEGQSTLANDIAKLTTPAGSPDHPRLRQLVQNLRTALVIPLKAKGGKTPAITPSPRQGVEDSIEDLRGLDISPITRSLQRVLGKHCLERDGNRCVITGFHLNHEGAPRNARIAPLEAAHIIPVALGSFDKYDPESVTRHRTLWNTFARYFPAVERYCQDSTLINEERNILTLTSTQHREFGEFRLVLEETRVVNQYKVKTFRDTYYEAKQNIPISKTIKFKKHAGEWDLPDPMLIKVHAAIGNFLHMSGGGESIDRILREIDDHDLFASDGSSNLADLLQVSLSLNESRRNQMAEREQTEEKQQQRRAQGKGSKTENQPFT